MSETTVGEVNVEEVVTEETVAEEVAVEEATEETKTSEDKEKKSKKDKKEKTKKKSWFKGLKAEFKKIIWPDKKTLVKQTVAVITCSVILGAIIAVVDALIQYGIDFLVR